jgi:hypothetical protein
MLVLVLCAAVIGVPAAVAYFLTESVWGTAVVAWGTALVPVVAILLLVAWAFRRYDVSDTAAE